MIRLVKVQNELKAPKSRKNSFGNYKYRSAEDILEAVKPLLAENNLSMVISDEVQELENGWVYVTAHVNIYDAENGSLIAHNSASARESASKKGMDVSQITGTASSYARKYALNGMFLIDDTKDADTDEYQKQTQEKAPSLATLKAKIKTAKLTDEEIENTLKHYKVDNLKDLTDEQKIELENGLTTRIQKRKELDDAGEN